MLVKITTRNKNISLKPRLKKFSKDQINFIPRKQIKLQHMQGKIAKNTIFTENDFYFYGILGISPVY